MRGERKGERGKIEGNKEQTRGREGKIVRKEKNKSSREVRKLFTLC